MKQPKLIYLISGKVNGVSYQPGKRDAFYHRYSYDAENRLTKVETSRDRIYWEREAQYSYYRHGLLFLTRRLSCIGKAEQDSRLRKQLLEITVYKKHDP